MTTSNEDWQEPEVDRRLFIFGYEYQIELIDKDTRALGQCGIGNMVRQAILIDASQCQEQRVSTLLHEALHLGSRHMGLDFPEDVIARLETLFYSVLVDNGVDLEPLHAKVR